MDEIADRFGTDKPAPTDAERAQAPAGDQLEGQGAGYADLLCSLCDGIALPDGRQYLSFLQGRAP